MTSDTYRALHKQEKMNHKIELDKFHCKGCGACEEVAPDVFKMDEAGEKADIINEEAGDLETLELAAVICPTKCIEVESEDG